MKIPYTQQERKVLDSLVEAWNAFCELSEYHPAHQQEFMAAIHAAERIVMIRPLKRMEDGGATEPGPDHELAEMIARRGFLNN